MTKLANWCFIIALGIIAIASWTICMWQARIDMAVYAIISSALVYMLRKEIKEETY